MATIIISLVFCLSLFLSSVPAHSAVFTVSSGDVTGLIAAINAANSNGEENTINLEPGTYTLTVNGPGGCGHFLDITSVMTINGESAETTIIERDSASPSFGILFVAASGRLTMTGITIRGGGFPVGFFGACMGNGAGINNEGLLTINSGIIEHNTIGLIGSGGGIFNTGTLTLSNTRVQRNSAGALAASRGGGIVNGGTATIIHSSITENGGDFVGGIDNSGTATIQNSTINGNSAMVDTGGISNTGTMTIMNSTIANNGASRGASGIAGAGTTNITNSTISGNVRSAPAISGSSLLTLQNTIVALNGSFDCSGGITSLGNNIIGTLQNCDINLLPSDLTGDPGLGAFVDNGAPGDGRFPLLPDSRAIDAGNGEACPATDQLDAPRRGACDIGAIKFYPVVNDLVAVGNVSTDFSAIGPGVGTFHIMAEFTNTSNQAIINPFAEVVELTGGNSLLNAHSAITMFLPGATETFELFIGLQKREPFTFFVNMLGDPQISNSSVSMRER